MSIPKFYCNAITKTIDPATGDVQLQAQLTRVPAAGNTDAHLMERVITHVMPFDSDGGFEVGQGYEMHLITSPLSDEEKARLVTSVSPPMRVFTGITQVMREVMNTSGGGGEAQVEKPDAEAQEVPINGTIGEEPAPVATEPARKAGFDDPAPAPAREVEDDVDERPIAGPM